MTARQGLLSFALAAVAALAVSGAVLAAAGWATYANPRFGTTADYPADLFTVQDPPPENGDGASFRTADDRAQLSIYGAYNVENDTPQSYVAKNDDFKSATYKRVTADFYVVSGTSGGTILLRPVQLSAQERRHPQLLPHHLSGGGEGGLGSDCDADQPVLAPRPAPMTPGPLSNAVG